MAQIITPEVKQAIINSYLESINCSFKKSEEEIKLEHNLFDMNVIKRYFKYKDNKCEFIIKKRFIKVIE